MLFGCPRQNIYHSSENLKVIYIECSMFHAIFNYEVKTSELENEEKSVKQTVQALKSYQNRLGICIFVQSVKLYSQLVVLENLMWPLKSPSKIIAIFCMKPVIIQELSFVFRRLCNFLSPFSHVVWSWPSAHVNNCTVLRRRWNKEYRMGRCKSFNFPIGWFRHKTSPPLSYSCIG